MTVKHRFWQRTVPFEVDDWTRLDENDFRLSVHIRAGATPTLWKEDLPDYPRVHFKVRADERGSSRFMSFASSEAFKGEIRGV